jgi:hypothetical protein
MNSTISHWKFGPLVQRLNFGRPIKLLIVSIESYWNQELVNSHKAYCIGIAHLLWKFLSRWYPSPSSWSISENCDISSVRIKQNISLCLRVCGLWGSHYDEVASVGFLACNAAWTCRLKSSLKMEVTPTSEKLVSAYKSTRHYTLFHFGAKVVTARYRGPCSWEDSKSALHFSFVTDTCYVMSVIDVQLWLLLIICQICFGRGLRFGRISRRTSLSHSSPQLCLMNCTTF